MGNSVVYSGDLSFDIKKPPTPFRQQTPGGLQYGKTIIIEGEVKTGVTGVRDRFNVNFKGNGKDVAFHYDVRFWKDDKAVIMNSRVKREWQDEERLINRYKKDEIFRLQIEITDEGFIVIDCNTYTPFTFLYRDNLTPEKVKKVTLKGNVQIKRVFYGALTNFNESLLSEQQHQFDHRLRHISTNPEIGYPHHHNDDRNGPSFMATLPRMQHCSHQSLPSYPGAQQQPWSPCHQGSTATLPPPYQQQPEANQPQASAKCACNSLLNYQHQPQSNSSDFLPPPPPYTSLHPTAPSAPSLENLSLDNPLYASNESNESARSAVSAPPTPPPRPLRGKQKGKLASAVSVKRAPPPRPPRPLVARRNTDQ